jgi:Haem-binding domain
MKRVKQLLKWLVVILGVLFIGVQFIRPARTNPTVDPSQTLESQAQVDPRVSAILNRSCVDCHSYKTRWPWYSNVAPVSWFVIDHVNHGRSNLNFSEWGKYNARRKGDKLDGMCELVKSGEMPLSSYTPMHPGSKLTSEDVKAICEWTNAEQERLQ